MEKDSKWKSITGFGKHQMLWIVGGEDIETFCMELELSLMLAEDERTKWEQGMEAT